MKLKGIDWGTHKQWSMWFNSMQREESYQVLMQERGDFGNAESLLKI